MKTRVPVLLVVTLLAAPAALAAKKQADSPAAPADDNAVVAKAHGGKIWIGTEAPSNTSGDKLLAWLGTQELAGEARQKEKDGPWEIHWLAVFKSPSLAGPLTVKWFEKGDLKNFVDMYSTPDNTEATLVYRTEHALDPNLGFNKNRTYVVQVGQLIKNKFKVYAQGSVSLK